MSKLKLESIIIAASIYLIIVLSIIFALVYTPSYPKAKVYVEKNEKAIEVSLGSPISKAKVEHKSKKKKVKKQKSKKIPKKVRNVKKSTKKPQKKIKIAKKKAPSKVHKKIDTAKLFHSLSKSLTNTKEEKNTKKVGNGGKSLRKANKAQGVVNKYLANVQRILQGWPAQSNFAGEKVRVKLTIYPSGLFDYKILYRSLNPEFNESLKHYLEQLKRVGFGPHSNPRPLEIIVEFIAK